MRRALVIAAISIPVIVVVGVVLGYVYDEVVSAHEVSRGVTADGVSLSRMSQPEAADAVLEAESPFDAETADELGLATVAPDSIDWEDELRLAIEERVSFSPDAMTGMEANLRFAGPETMETRIFGRLTAWQNWIFQRPNAVGEDGALQRYGIGKRGEYDMRRV